METTNYTYDRNGRRVKTYVPSKADEEIKVADIIKELKERFRLFDYDSLKRGTYLETSYGEFVCTTRPAITLPIDQRYWIFEQTTDVDGEPCADGQAIIIAAQVGAYRCPVCNRLNTMQPHVRKGKYASIQCTKCGEMFTKEQLNQAWDINL